MPSQDLNRRNALSVPTKVPVGSRRQDQIARLFPPIFDEAPASAARCCTNVPLHHSPESLAEIIHAEFIGKPLYYPVLFCLSK